MHTEEMDGNRHVKVTYYFLIIGFSTAVGCGQCRGTLFQVPRFLSTFSCTADGDGVDAVGIAITRAVVFAPSTIARCPDKHRAKASPPLLTDEESQRHEKAGPQVADEENH